MASKKNNLDLELLIITIIPYILIKQHVWMFEAAKLDKII
ncbi:hypothetical protein LCGC14_0198560 [marine sediment metagenome]|uniref:Uncharacterized protein n=1 Tax=marine sediment metagenome TaxID=412755 RepID=A0A0F9XMP9_9ZZZZ